MLFRMHIVQTINAGASSIGHSNCLIGILVSRILTVMITEDNRFRFMKIRLDHIDKLILHERTAVLDVHLYGNGCYMTNGLMEKAGVVSMMFENQTQAIEFRDTFESQCRSAKGVNGGFTDTNRFSTIAKSGPHGQRGTTAEPFLCRTRVVDDSITLGLNTCKPTAQDLRRKPSYAAIMLSFEEEVINGSSAHLDLSSSDSPSERDQDKSHTQGERQLNNDDYPGPAESEYWGSYPSRVNETPEPRHPLGSRSHSQERDPSPQIAPNIVNPSKTREMSCNGETQPESGAVEPHISHEGGDCHFGLPSLARQALQLQPHDSNSLTDVPVQQDQVVGSSLDLRGLLVEQTSPTDNNLTVDPEHPADIQVEDSTPKDTNPSPVNPTTMGQQINVPVKDTSEKHNEAEMPNQTGSNSKLKRPHHRISGSKADQLTVDWDQDLRVEDTLVDRAASSSKRQKKTPPQPKGLTKTSKTKSVSRSSGKKKKRNQQEQGLPLTPHIVSTLAKSKTKKAGRQVTKTLTSARQRRAAAEKANQKLALANEYENATYDLDDPIESSLPEEWNLASNQGNWEGSTDAILPVVTSEDVQVQPLPSIEGVVNAKTNPPTIEFSNQIVSPETSGSKRAAGNDIFLTVQEDTDHNLDLQGTILTAREQSPSAHPVEVDNTETLSKIDIPHPKTVVECKENNLGKRLSEALAKAGILSSNFMIAGNNVNCESHSHSINSTEGQVQKGLSEISKNVSQFIARQAVVGQRYSIDEHGKLDDSKAQPAKNGEVPVKIVKPNVVTDQSASEDFENQHEGPPIVPTMQCQPTAAAELRGILKPDSNGQNKVKENYNDVRPETAVVLRKVQLVGFDSNGPKNQCAISGGPASRNAKKFDIIPNETHKNGNEDAHPRENRLKIHSDDGINEIDDMDEVSLVPTSECLSLGVDSENGHIASQIRSSSVCEVTEAEFRSQRRASHPIPALSQTVDENGSPQPLRRDLCANRSTANIPSEVELHVDTSGTSPPSGVSASLSGEELGVDHRTSACSDSESTHVDHVVRSLAVNNESSNNSNSETPHQRRDASSKQKCPNIGSFAVRDRSNPMSNSFWRRSAPSTFAERLRGRKRTKQNKKSKTNKVAHKHSVMMKKASQKLNIMPFVEFSSEFEQGIDNSEAETYDAESGYWDTAGVSSVSSSHLSDTLVEEYRDVESEWQNALRATQKTSLDILLDTSGVSDTHPYL